MIEPNNRQYNKATAAYLGFMAALVYEANEYVTKTLKSLKSQNIHIYDKNNTQAFLVEFKDFSVLAFRGTECIADWITNFHFHLQREGQFAAHSGFIEGLDVIWADIIENVNDKKTLFLTGHSLGGGIASICSARLWHLEIPHITYTFGCPRALSEYYADYYNSRFKQFTHRYVNNNDIVTRVPPRNFCFGHIGTFHYFKEDGKQDDEISWFSKLLDSIDGRVRDITKLGTDGVKDHKMAIYLHNLEKNNVGNS